LPRSSPSSSLSLAASIVVGRRSPAVVVVRFVLKVLWSIHVYQECDQISANRHCSRISLSPTISHLLKTWPPMEPRNNTVSPQPDTATTRSSGGIKRHHTISTASRLVHTNSRLIDDVQPSWNGGGDEAVDPDWVGGVGAVGEKSSLHRQASLPTRHHPRRKSLLFCIGIPNSPFSDNLADHSGSLKDPARWHLNPAYAQQSLYHRRPRGGRRLGSFGTRGARPPPGGRRGKCSDSISLYFPSATSAKTHPASLPTTSSNQFILQKSLLGSLVRSGLRAEYPRE